mmetsp:Transcript_3164/g.5991  ORF Transcript_3164/g.5991 Transcript_3164/m.5991 type:complete len:380 (-) Transcript_3164:2189-3328(-)
MEPKEVLNRAVEHDWITADSRHVQVELRKGLKQHLQEILASTEDLGFLAMVMYGSTHNGTAVSETESNVDLAVVLEKEWTTIEERLLAEQTFCRAVASRFASTVKTREFREVYLSWTDDGAVASQCAFGYPVVRLVEGIQGQPDVNLTISWRLVEPPLLDQDEPPTPDPEDLTEVDSPIETPNNDQDPTKVISPIETSNTIEERTTAFILLLGLLDVRYRKLVIWLKMWIRDTSNIPSFGYGSVRSYTLCVLLYHYLRIEEKMFAKASLLLKAYDDVRTTVHEFQVEDLGRLFKTVTWPVGLGCSASITAGEILFHLLKWMSSSRSFQRDIPGCYVCPVTGQSVDPGGAAEKRLVASAQLKLRDISKHAPMGHYPRHYH